jgi:hypothetical protein
MPVLNHDTAPPPGWPAGVTYLTRSRLSPTFERARLPLLTPSSNDSPASSKIATPSKQPQSQPFPKDLIKIKKITEPSHPAFGQLGLVALKKIEPRTKVLSYLGVYHTRPHSESDYDLSVLRIRDEDSLDPEATIDIALDAAKSGNAGRFVNDYRGIGSAPNCQFVEAVDTNGWIGMEVWTLGKGVGKGEELLVSYGKGWWAGRQV